MALYTQKEFADACGQVRQNVNNAISRFKLVLNEDGLIDDTNPLNRQQMQLWQSKMKQPAPLTAAQELQFPAETTSRRQVKAVDPEMATASVEKMKASTSKAQVEVQLKTIQHQKLLGELLPTTIASRIISEFSRAMVLSFKESVDNMVTEISHVKSFSLDETADLRGQLIEIINDCSRSSVSLAKRGMENAISEFTNKRGIGQHG